MISKQEMKLREAQASARLAYQAFIDRRALAIQRFHSDPEFKHRVRAVIAAIKAGRSKKEWTAVEQVDVFGDAISAVIALQLIEEARQ